ncbi:MAG: hypothetical protein IFK92_02220, partial [Acidobacteria bacterium]|nr:hypothetical protein [Candidatus Sulfomarinibacter kjeldsenii]
VTQGFEDLPRDVVFCAFDRLRVRPMDPSLVFEGGGDGLFQIHVCLQLLAFRSYYGQIAFAVQTMGRGAGLGLAIAKRAVELHGGNIYCESTVGEGTTFRFELPADTPVLNPPPLPA